MIIGLVDLVAINGTTILVVYLQVKSWQHLKIWNSHRFHIPVKRHEQIWQCIKSIAPAMATRVTFPTEFNSIWPSDATWHHQSLSPLVQLMACCLKAPNHSYTRHIQDPKLIVTWARFLSHAWSKLRLCSANHRPGYWSNLPCDWQSTAWAYSEQETENRPWWCIYAKWVSTNSGNGLSLGSCVLSSVLLQARRTNYHKISNIRCTKSPNLNVPRIVLRLSLPNPMKPCVKSRMKM